MEQLRDGSLVEAFSVSLLRLAIGFSLALVVGSVVVCDGDVAAHRGHVPRLRRRGAHVPVPHLGLLVAIWFGFGPIGPVLVVFIAGLPYVMLNASEGVRDVSKELRDMATAYEVPRNRTLRHLISFPSLSPFFFASLRYGLANGWKGLVLAEVFAATSGAGYHINEMREYGDFAGVVGFACTSRSSRSSWSGWCSAVSPGARVSLATRGRARGERDPRGDRSMTRTNEEA